MAEHDRTIVDASGRPARTADDGHPHGSGSNRICRSLRRRRSGGFGEWHDLCAECGRGFPGEQTADD